MYDREVNQILTLLREGQEAEARTLFMAHLLAHCRALDQALGQVYGWEPNTDERLWQVFKGMQHMGWFHQYLTWPSLLLYELSPKLQP